MTSAARVATACASARTSTFNTPCPPGYCLAFWLLSYT